MNLQARLLGLVARRFLPPAALALFAAAMALAFFLPWSPSNVGGVGELSQEVNAGLAREGVWLTALAVALPWFCARACWCVRQWRQGDGDWLGTGVLSRANVAACHLCGAGLALAIVLVPFAIAAELRAGSVGPHLRWIADLKVSPVALLTAADRASISVDPPSRASVLLARFVIAAPDSGGPQARLRCDVAREHAADFSLDLLVTASTPLEIELKGGDAAVHLTFQRVGPGAAVVLEDSRLQCFEGNPARWSIALALFLHAWLAIGVACAIAWGSAIWTSPFTAMLCVFGAQACAWLGLNLSLAWPSVGLRDALELCSDGLAPGYPAWMTWIGALLAGATAVGLAALQRDLWRRGA